MRPGKEIDLLLAIRAKARRAVLASYPTDTASGSPASFPDGADDVPVVDLKVSIQPVQEGSGDPSPENIRPISGWTAANVTRAGKNLLRTSLDNPYTNNGITYTRLSDGSISASGTAGPSLSQFAMNSVMELRPGDYYFTSGIASGGSSTTWDAGIWDSTISRYAVQWDGSTGGVSYDPSFKQVKITEGHTYQFILHVRVGATADNLVFRPMICVATETDTTYEPYLRSTLSIPFPNEAGTVYGGTLDVTTGLLTVTRGQIASYAGETLPGDWISDRDVYAEGTSPSTGAQVVYELAEPITYQLTPTQVRTLYGENNLWADTGDVTAEYRADLEKYIEKKIGEGGIGTLSLGASPSMIRPGAGLQSQSLGLDDAGSEYPGELEEKIAGEYWPEEEAGYFMPEDGLNGDAEPEKTPEEVPEETGPEETEADYGTGG